MISRPNLTRNSSFELLRLVLMCMIVVHHGIVHGLGLSELGWGNMARYQFSLSGYDAGIAITINSLCICAVNCFVLISGYFGIRLSGRKVVSLLLTTLFFTIIFVTGYNIWQHDYKKSLFSLLFLSHTDYWFVVDYIFLMFFAPVFNKYHGKVLVWLMLIVSCWFGFIWNFQANPNGYTLFQFFLLYCIGRYIRTNNISISRSKSILLYLGGALAVATLFYMFYVNGMNELAWKMTRYNNPLIILSGIGLFMLFKSFTIKSGIINKLAKSTFAIYLFQNSDAISSYYYDFVNYLSLETSICEILLIIILLTIVIFVCAIIIDKVEKIINIKLLSALLSRFPILYRQIE